MAQLKGIESALAELTAALERRPEPCATPARSARPGRSASGLSSIDLQALRDRLDRLMQPRPYVAESPAVGDPRPAGRELPWWRRQAVMFGRGGAEQER